MIDTLVAIPPEKRTFANTVLPLAQFESDFSSVNHNIGFYKSVSPDKKLVKKSLELVQKFEEFGAK